MSATGRETEAREAYFASIPPRAPLKPGPFPPQAAGTRWDPLVEREEKLRLPQPWRTLGAAKRGRPPKLSQPCL